MSWTAAACPWCGAPYTVPRVWYGINAPHPQPTCQCHYLQSLRPAFRNPYGALQGTNIHGGGPFTVPPPSVPPVREQTDKEAIAALEERLDTLTLELARLRRERQQEA